MDEYDYELIAIVNGWLKLKRGLYHPFALQYIGWFNEYKCFKTAKEALEYQLTINCKAVIVHKSTEEMI